MNPILVLARNNIHLTKKAITSFRKQDIPVEILLIDNGSTDGTSDWIKTQHDIGYIYNDQPKGVAASWNQGLWYWFRKGAQHCLVVNNDVELIPFTYDYLIQSGLPFVTAVGVREMPKEIHLPDVFTKLRPHPDFSCFLIQRETYEKVGVFDEKFLCAFGEDWDYHVRLHKVGITAQCIDLPFLHHGSMTIKNANPKEIKDIQVQADKNRSYFKEKWGMAGASEEYYKLFGNSAPISHE